MARPARALVFTMASASALLYYATVVEPSRLEVAEVVVRDSRLSQALAGRKAAFLSDLHFDDDAEPAAARALRVLDDVRPDLILLGGDLVEWDSGAAGYERALDFLSRLDAPLGVFAVLGDSDRTSSRRSCLLCHQPGSGSPTTRHRVRFLRNAAATLDLAGGTLNVIGLDPNCSSAPVAPVRALLSADAPSILLSHSSGVFRQLDPSREVMTLSGDTHGGQILLPTWLWRLTRLKPDPEHMSGFFQEGRKSLFVTRGVGTSHVRFRLGASPEIVIFTFAGGLR